MMKQIISIVILSVLIGINSYGQVNKPTDIFQPQTGGLSLTYPTYTVDPDSSDFNYIRTWVPRTPVYSITSTWNQNIGVSTQYLNGNGQTLQTIQHGGFVQGDIVKVNLLKPSTDVKNLPVYSDPKDTKFRMNAFSDMDVFNNNTYPDENGHFIQGSELYMNNGIRYRYTVNAGASFSAEPVITYTEYNNSTNSDQEVYKWNYSDANNRPEIYGYYNSNELTIHTAKQDYHNSHVMTFYNKTGQLICKKVHDGNDWLTTYYVYNELGRLVWVIPPKATATLPGSPSFPVSLSQTVCDQLCHHYSYDIYGQVIERNIPDRDYLEITVYDKKNRPVLYRNGILADSGQWTFTVYDKRDRVVFSGIYSNTTYTRSNWQQYLENGWDNITYPNIPDLYWYLKDDFTGTYPSSITDCEINVFNYYDDYADLPSLFSGISYYSYQTSDFISSLETVLPVQSENTYGQLVGSSVRILDPANNNRWINSKFFYDFEGKLIQSQTMNPWNTNNDWDITTNQYDFTDNVVLVINEHYSWNNTNKPHTKIMTHYVYNYDKGELTNVKQKTDNNGWKDLSYRTYDDLRRLQKKHLGNVEHQEYAYNVRGQLTAINEAYVYDTSADFNKTYGEIICYDYGFDEKRLDGKATGYIYRGAGRTTYPRAYGYLYDAAGRMTDADFHERFTPGHPPQDFWNKNTDYSVSNISYDENGNMLSMDQRGMAIVGGNMQAVTMDELTYNYQTNSNRLDNMVDNIGVDYNLYDFLDSNNTGSDYTYDANGNLAQDLNKHISGIVYNYMDLPVTVQTNNGSVTNLYDATGTLLEKTVVDNINGNYVERFWGPYVYMDDTLQYFLHEEGRARYDEVDDEFENDFFVKDHLDNVRTVVNAEVTTGAPHFYHASFEVHASTMEESLFEQIGPVRDNKPQSNPQDLMSGKLNGTIPDERIGAAILIQAMAGDQFNLSGYGYYEDEGPFNSYTMPEYMASSLASALTGAAGETGMEGGPVTELTNSLLSTTNYNLYDAMKQSITNPNYPRAYLNYLVFDENFDLLTGESHVIQLTGSQNTWTLMQLPTVMTMQTNGYLMVYFSNESDVDVYVDNEFITHYKGVLLEEQHYYPHGLTIDKTFGGIDPENMYLHQAKKLQRELGLELYDFHARQYDPQIGRFWGVDPADQFPSGYTGMANDPGNFIDPTGMIAQGVNASDYGSDPFDPEAGRSGITTWENNPNGPSEANLLFYYMEYMSGGGGSDIEADNDNTGDDKNKRAKENKDEASEESAQKSGTENNTQTTTSNHTPNAEYNTGEGALTPAQFSDQYEGMTVNEMTGYKQTIHPLGVPITFDATLSKENTRYVQLANGNIVDMRHFLTVGQRGFAMGIGNEVRQIVTSPKSAFNMNDWYSNSLGVQFFGQYSVRINQNPTLISKYIYQFFNQNSVLYPKPYINNTIVGPKY